MTWRVDYYREAIESAAEEHGVVMTTEQAKAMAVDLTRAIENEGMASGAWCIPNPLMGEISQLKGELKRERSKVICRECNGHGRIEIHGPYHSSNSGCSKCGGEGWRAP